LDPREFENVGVSHASEDEQGVQEQWPQQCCGMKLQWRSWQRRAARLAALEFFVLRPWLSIAIVETSMNA
jgi:hypothetical protein